MLWVHSSTSYSMRQPLYLLQNVSLNGILPRRYLGSLQAAHHTGFRCSGARNRVGADVALVAYDIDTDHGQIVDVLQIIADDLLSDVVSALVDHQVASRTLCDFSSQVHPHSLLPVLPLNMNLRQVSDHSMPNGLADLTLFCLMYKSDLRTYS